MSRVSLDELTVDETGVSWTLTEEDPDGADRGGYHQADHSLRVEGSKLTYSLTLSEHYEERNGGVPDSDVADREDALQFLDRKLAQLAKATATLQSLRTLVEATTEFASELPESDEEDDDD